MLSNPKQASQIINEVLKDISPERYELLERIIQIEEAHLADKATITPGLIAAEIEKVAKLENGGDK